jgi:hypothetical protein
MQFGWQYVGKIKIEPLLKKINQKIKYKNIFRITVLN